MKSISQSDLQHLFASPTQQETEEMQKAMNRFAEHHEEEKCFRFAKPRLAFIVAAALVILTGVVAIAVTSDVFNGYWITWGGKREAIPQSTVQYENEPEFTDERSNRMQEILRNVPDQYYATIDWNEGHAGSVKEKRRAVYSLDELTGALDQAMYPHPAIMVPDGYDFVNAELIYGCKPEGNYMLISRSVVDEFTLEQYSIAPEDETIIGYSVNIQPEGMKRIDNIRSSMLSSPDMRFGFDSEDDCEVTALSVPGMEEAMYVQYLTDHSALLMLRRLEQPVSVSARPLAFAEDLEKDRGPVSVYSYEHLAMNGIPLDAALSLFGDR